MSERKIKLTALQDVKEFVNAAEQCDFDIDVFYNRVIIDAKSILGVLSLDLSRELTVKYGGQNMAFENILKKWKAQKTKYLRKECTGYIVIVSGVFFMV